MTQHSRRKVRVDQVPYGRGVFAVRSIRAGEVVGRVAGRVIDDPDYSSSNCIDLGDPLSLEPYSPFRFLNHSCEPNCELWVITDPDAPHAIPRVVVEAVAEIAPGDELTIDYAWSGNDLMACLCGSPRCRGWIVAADKVVTVRRRLQRVAGRQAARREMHGSVERLLTQADESAGGAG